MRCAEEFPLLRQAEEKHSGEGLKVYYIGHQDRLQNLVRYAKDNNVPDFLFDPDDSMSRKFGITYGAGVVFINRDAVVKSRIPRGISSSMVEAELQKIL